MNPTNIFSLDTDAALLCSSLRFPSPSLTFHSDIGLFAAFALFSTYAFVSLRPVCSFGWIGKCFCPFHSASLDLLSPIASYEEPTLTSLAWLGNYIYGGIGVDLHACNSCETWVFPLYLSLVEWKPRGSHTSGAIPYPPVSLDLRTIHKIRTWETFFSHTYPDLYIMTQRPSSRCSFSFRACPGCTPRLLDPRPCVDLTLLGGSLC